MGKIIAKATYRYELPFLFGGREYYDSASLVMALVEYWDIGLMAAKRGEFAVFFDYLSEEDLAYQELAQKAETLFLHLHGAGRDPAFGMEEDLAYAGFLLAMEPDMPGVPVIRFGAVKGEICGEEEIAAWAAEVSPGQQNIPDTYDPKRWDGWILQQYQNSSLILVERR